MRAFQGHIGELEFTVIDTGGLDDQGMLESQMLPFTTNVLKTADVVLFMVDARKGVSPDDQHFAKWVRPHWCLSCVGVLFVSTAGNLGCLVVILLRSCGMGTCCTCAGGLHGGVFPRAVTLPGVALLAPDGF